MSKLSIYNSLTQKREPFKVPNNHIKYYLCGVTVYDASHLGHARTYIMFDVIRRLLRDYFNYSITLVMNITDIDDKIINKANEEGKDFKEVAKYWENEFLNDMKQLNVEPPTVLTRVSDYIPAIIKYVEVLIAKNMAYFANGSVYFNSENFAKTHTSKLTPHHDDTKDDEVYSSEKRSPKDFSLLKAAKPNEPFWDSQWGPIRPSWHIECSVMAHEVLGDHLTLHSGGEDLKFPHHANEIAQSEAYSGTQNWVDYFIHSGHLHIDGAKMSKSLKNFITIKSVLQQYDANTLRISFLLHRYGATMDYSEDGMKYAQSINTIFTNFVANMQPNRFNSYVNGVWTAPDAQFHNEYLGIKTKIDAAFKDNFDTPTFILSLSELISATNKYIKNPSAQLNLLIDVTQFIFKMFSLVGLIYGTNDSSSTDLTSNVLDLFLKYRNEIRVAAKTKNIGKVFELSDQIRDVQLPTLGFKISDDPKTGQSYWSKM